MKISVSILFLSVVFLSCNPTPSLIEYGEDACDFCKMTIVDSRFGSELVSSKGKAFKFDAIECMVQYYKEKKEVTFPLMLVNQYDIPEVLSDFRQSYFLVSEAIPSPMGANLSAYSSKNAAEEMKELKGGHVYDWQEILNLNNKTSDL